MAQPALLPDNDNEEYPSFDDSADYLLRQQKSALANITGERDPDAAARSLELGQASGVPAALIRTDPENYDQQYKSALTAQLLKNNQYLMEYAKNGVNAEVSANDWGALDEHSDAFAKFQAQMQKGLFYAPMRGFAKGFGNEPQGSWYAPSPGDVEFEKQYPNLYALGKQAIIGLGEPIELAARIFSGFVGAGHETAKAYYKALGGDDTQADKFANAIAGMAEYEATKGEGVSDVAKYVEAYHAAKPWVQARMEPPRGLHPEIDKAIVQDSKEGMKALDEVMKTRDKTETFELAPETAYRDFAKQFGEGYIGVSADAVRKLYGDKLPEPEDGLLGWVPDIQRQLEGAGRFDDIEIPQAEFVSKMDSDLYKELHDSIRVRPGAMTVEETKPPEAKRTPEEEEYGKPYQAPEAKAEPEGEGQLKSSIESARDAAGLNPKYAKDLLGAGQIDQTMPSKLYKLETSAGPIHYLQPTKEWSEAEDRVMSALDDYMKKIAPRFKTEEQLIPTRGIEHQGYQAHGIYAPMTGKPAFIFYSLHNSGGEFRAPEELIGVLRHEAIHYLKNNGFFTTSEWRILSQAAREQGWIEKHKIDKNYPEVDHRGQIEEAIAHEFEKWNLKPESTHIASDVFKKMRDVMLKMAEFVKEYMGFDPKVEDIFHRIEEGEIGKRPIEGPEIAEEPELRASKEDTTKSPIQSVTGANFAKAIVEKYMKRIAQRNAEDAEHLQKVAETRAREQLTKEWKDREKELRPEVQRDVDSRPDILADKLLQDGTWHGEKVEKVRLAEELLTPEQKAALPPRAWGKDGVDPAVIAGLVGYTSPEQLISRLAELHSQRELEGLTRAAQFNKIVSVELERRMQAEGKLEDKIIEETLDYLPSQTQIDLLSDETYALAEMTGQKVPLDLKAMAQQAFGQVSMGQATREALLRSSNLAGEQVQTHLLNDKPVEAFKAKLDQTLTMIKLKDANKLAKERDAWDRNAKVMGRAQVKGVDPDYLPWIRSILVRSGEKVRRTMADINSDIAAAAYKTLSDFVDAKQAMLRELPIADFLLDPNWDMVKKGLTLDDLSVDQFRALNSSVKALIHNGREEMKAYTGGNARDLKETIDQMVDQLGEFAVKPESMNLGPISKAIKAIRTYGAAHLQIESIMNRIDNGDPFGLFSKYIMRDLVESATNEANLTRETAGKIRENKYQGDINEPIPNNIWRSPTTGIIFNDMKRVNLLAAMMYTGTDVRLKKLAEGYNLTQDQVMQWIHSIATKEDWDFVRGKWAIFKDLKGEADEMYRRLAGEAPANEPTRQVETPFGTFEGGYAPLIYDRRWSTGSKKLLGGDPLEQHGYEKATTAASYTKEVTGFTGALQLNLDALPARMTQMIHDISFRESVINAGKFFYNKNFQDAFRRHFGDVYSDLLVPYLKDVANYTNTPMDSAKATYQYYGNIARQNMVRVLVDMNPNTIMKHGTTALAQSIKDAGGVRFATYMVKMLQGNEETAQSNWDFARTKFDEIARRERNFIDTLGGSSEIAMTGMPWKDMIQKYGSYLITKSDLLSAVPLALSEYDKAISAGMSDGDAVQLANRAVRRTHGSSVITNLSRIQRTKDPILGSFVSLFGFYNHMTNRLYEIGWKAHDTYLDIKAGKEEKYQHVPDILSGLFYYAIVPAVIGGAVTGVKKNQSWTGWAVDALLHELAGSWAGGRDLADAVLHGSDFSAGLVSTAGGTVFNLARDIGHITSNVYQGREVLDHNHAGTLALHAFELGGLMSGLTNAQEGRMAEFLTNWYRGRESPKGWADIGRGIWHGTLKEKR